MVQALITKHPDVRVAITVETRSLAGVILVPDYRNEVRERLDVFVLRRGMGGEVRDALGLLHACTDVCVTKKSFDDAF
jgi:hypothetical protein